MRLVPSVPRFPQGNELGMQQCKWSNRSVSAIVTLPLQTLLEALMECSLDITMSYAKEEPIS